MSYKEGMPIDIGEGQYFNFGMLAGLRALDNASGPQDGVVQPAPKPPKEHKPKSKPQKV